MDTQQYEQLWLLGYCAALVICFGLGAIKGGQR